MRRLLAAVLLVGACAASANRAGPPPAAPTEDANVEQLYVELLNHDNEFRRETIGDGPVPRCKRMKQLRDNICALAERICRIADKEPPGSQAAQHCNDGKARCRNATERTAVPACAPGLLQ